MNKKPISRQAAIRHAKSMVDELELCGSNIYRFRYFDSDKNEWVTSEPKQNRQAVLERRHKLIEHGLKALNDDPDFKLTESPVGKNWIDCVKR